MKNYKIGDKVTVSYDRSHKIDCELFLSCQRADLSEKWKDQDGLKHEVWEAIDTTDGSKRVLIDRNFPEQKVSDAEFFIEPDFDNDL